MHCLEPENLLYNDLRPEDAKTWVAALKPQPAAGWDSTVTFCGWRQVPSVYVVTEDDKCIPPAMQLQLAETAGSKVVKCGSGHVPMVSMLEKLAEVVKTATEEV